MVKAITLLTMELKEKFRYKIELFSASTDALLLVFPAIAILLFGDFQISGISSKTDYIQYMLFSLILWQFIENMWSAVFEIRRKLREGNFEYMMCMPLKGIHYIFGWAVSGIISMVLEMIPLIILFVIFSFHSMSLNALINILLIVLVMAFGTYGFAEMLMGLAIYFREADQIVSLAANIAPFLAGLYFPVIQLPIVFQSIAMVFPFTWGLDLVRNVLFHSSMLFPIQKEWIAFIIINILYALFGSKVYDHMIRKARKNGLSKF